MERSRVKVIITTGGTGITRRDSTYEALVGLFDKRLEGFGELFRMLSFEEIGSAAMMSRATAGIVGRCALFLLPGSEAAVRLAMTRLIIPELGHVARELNR
jgi:molybdenum cofactor biosynthesis protein B